eukprot:TRINITY_DN144_c1_g3_i1.p1 TRINITY_DN144_c1_g3~~TRINITY_DN144_c1_g3_i1.p1  ORF type:complete len:196 (+),score=42.54 TRINITY_DN144_c1_g3_i1:487-1074(+)
MLNTRSGFGDKTSASLPLKTLLENNRRLEAQLEAKTAQLEALQVKYEHALDQLQQADRRGAAAAAGGAAASTRKAQQHPGASAAQDDAADDEPVKKQLLRFAERQMALLQKNSELEDKILLLENENAQIKIQLLYFSNQYMQFRRALESKFDVLKARALLKEAKEADDLKVLFNALSINGPARSQPLLKRSVSTT